MKVTWEVLNFWGSTSSHKSSRLLCSELIFHQHWEVTVPQLNSSLKYFTKWLCWVPLIKQSASESSFSPRYGRQTLTISLCRGARYCLFWEICLPGKWPELPSLLVLDKCLRTKGKQFVQLFPSIGSWTVGLNKAFLHPTVPIYPYQVQQRKCGGALLWE